MNRSRTFDDCFSRKTFLPPNVKDEPRPQLARAVRKHVSLELLGNDARTIKVRRGDFDDSRRTRTLRPIVPKTIGEHVQKKRTGEGLTQGQLAATLGVWRATLGAWEANHYEPTGKVRARVVAWLGFDPDAGA